MVSTFCIAVIMFCCVHLGYKFDSWDKGSAGGATAIFEMLIVIFALVVLRFG